MQLSGCLRRKTNGSQIGRRQRSETILYYIKWIWYWVQKIRRIGVWKIANALTININTPVRLVQLSLTSDDSLTSFDLIRISGARFLNNKFTREGIELIARVGKSSNWFTEKKKNKINDLRSHWRLIIRGLNAGISKVKSPVIFWTQSYIHMGASVIYVYLEATECFTETRLA